jgi:hypothetical protein
MMLSLQLMCSNNIFFHLANFDAPQSGLIKLPIVFSALVCGACGRRNSRVSFSRMIKRPMAACTLAS